jgi:deoxyribonuclease-4
MKAKRQKPDSVSTSAPLLGAHMSIAGGVEKSIDRALSVGCTAMQVFVKNNMQWFAAPFSEKEITAWRTHPRRGELRCVFAHSGYMINLGATNPDFLDKSLRALAEELTRADQLGLPWLVLHPGAHMGTGAEAGLKRIVEGIDEVFRRIPKVKTRIALEATAGQGSSLGHTFEQLAFLLEHAHEPKRLCICLDTAHIFAAGYDISTKEKTRAVFEKFDDVIGLDHLAAIHMNDSKAALGSRVDRHEHIGKGKIGIEAFRFIMNEPRFTNVPKVLETPKGADLKEDVENLALLRSLIGKR